MLILGILLLVGGAGVAFMVNGVIGICMAGGGLYALFRYALEQSEGPRPVAREYGGSGQSTYNLSSKPQARDRR